ncbi:ABC transporter substrate-binding protein [Bifidobacterium rousetti]|uniref:ABC transporter substrate-binding protein n=1 Tax=Bifidobacterium rousetti TaxID=2045439 RepID=UPI001238648E|nr:sugar ABC transporter substrate-binding protein [Bifidobacterium rousetti]KAA8818570.1 ABC transporter substrate-binding protein [Bifidobacterium rousetti]
MSMGMSMRKLAAAGLAAATLLSVAACGGQSASNTAGGSADGGKTEITVWAWEPLISKTVEGFEKENPDITVKVVNAGTNNDEYTALSNAVNAGSGAPDLVQLDYNAVPQFAYSDALEDLSQYGGDKILDKFTTGAQAGVTVDGKMYGMPMGTGPMALFYNKEIFDKAGVTEAPKSWDEYYEAAKKIHALGSDYYITSDSGDAGFAMSMIWLAGGQPFKVDGSKVSIDLTGDSGVKAFAQFWQKMIDEDLIDTKTAGWSDDWYKSLNTGHIASLMTGAWMPITLEGSVTDAAGKYRVANTPTPDGSAVNSENGGGALAVVKGSKNAEAAYKFAEYVGLGGGNKTFTEGGSFPPDTATLEESSFTDKTSDYFGGQKVNEVLAEGAKNVKESFTFLPFQVYGNSIYADTVGKAFSGDGTLMDGFKDWQNKLVEYGDGQGFEVNK